MNDIQFFCLEPVPALKDRKRLKSFLVSTTTMNGRKLSALNVIFCSDEHLLTINKDFLQHDYYTDIITFDLSPSGKSPIEAELYISIERVRDNAQSLGFPFYKELHRVVFHGLLHLMGYKDKKKTDQQTMRKMEDKLLADYFGPKDM